MSPSTVISPDHGDLARLVADVAQGSRERRTVDDSLDPAWEHYLDLGLTAVSVGEELGGADGSFLDEVVLVAETARHGVDVPLAETLVSSWAMSHDGPVSTATRTIALTRGSADVWLPWSRWADDIVLLDADRAVRVTGDVGHAAQVEDMAGVPVQVVPRGLATEGDALSCDVRLASARLAVLRAAQILGASVAVHDITLEHVSTREQFGKPLLAIPAVKSSLAQIVTHLTQLECAIERAAVRLSADGPVDPDDALDAAAVARVIAGRAATEVAAKGHQLHGAIGITGEYPLSAHTRRLWSWRDLDGSQQAWTVGLGRNARISGEAHTWSSVTAP